MNTLRTAFRNLLRNRWRSRLTAGGVAVAVAFLVWTQGLMDSFFDAMVKTATRVQLADVVIQTEEWVGSPSINSAFDADAARMHSIASVPGVAGVASRIETFGLVGHERRSQVAFVVGVEPERERAVSAVPGSVIEGRWLTGARGPAETGPIEAVLGEGFARQLGAKVGDELVILLQAADGSLGNDLLRVTGIARTGNSTIDRQAVYLPLADAQFLTALDGHVHEVVVQLSRGADLNTTAAAIRVALGAATGAHHSPLVARTWKQVVPELAQMIDFSQSSMWFLYLIVFIVAGLGIVNAQRMSALERRREFGVMLAIGTTPGRLGRMVVVETVLLTGAGALVGAAVGLGVNAWFQARGFDMRMFSAGGTAMSWQGTTFDRLYFHVTAYSVLMPMVTIVALGIVCGFWPALKAARVNAVQAIAGRN